MKQKVEQGISNIVNSIINWFKELPQNMLNIGKNIVEGIWNGISNGFTWIKNKITEWVGNVLDFIKGLFGIHSPSTLFRDEIGDNLAKGIGVGFSDTMKDVSNDMANAIPTEFDVNSTLTGSKSKETNLKEALLEAFKEFKPAVILNDKEIGEFAFEYGNVKYGNYYN